MAKAILATAVVPWWGPRIIVKDINKAILVQNRPRLRVARALPRVRGSALRMFYNSVSHPIERLQTTGGSFFLVSQLDYLRGVARPHARAT